MKIIKFIFFLLLIFQTSFSQTNETISEGFTKLEGLEYTGNITFYLEKETQTILAYQRRKIKWEKSIMKVCEKPSVGKTKIREVRIENKYLKIVYGKHSFVRIEIETGKVICEGED